MTIIEAFRSSTSCTFLNRAIELNFSSRTSYFWKLFFQSVDGALRYMAL